MIVDYLYNVIFDLTPLKYKRSDTFGKVELELMITATNFIEH